MSVIEEPAPNSSGDKASVYDLIIALVCIFSLILIFGKFGIPDISPTVHQTFDFFDNIICGVFFIDFLITLKRSPAKKKYLLTWGWVDLISCIPAISYFRAGRLARLLRVIRIFRVIKSTKTLWMMLFTRNFKNTLFAVGAFALLTMAAGSCAILLAEQNQPEANIKDMEDALWWAYATITTIGYEDHFPVTGYGRIISAILGTIGIGLVGIFTASLAATMLRHNNKQEQK